MTRREPNPDERRIEIRAGRTSPPTCLVTWHGRELVLTCATVRELAMGMLAAAARAEAEAAAVAVAREQAAPDQVIAGHLVALRSRYAEHGFGIKGTLTMIPAVSLFDGRPFAHANVKPYEPLRLAPEELRGIAAQWIEVAEAAERDAILDYALREATDLDDEQIDRVFAVARNVRPDGLHDERSA